MPSLQPQLLWRHNYININTTLIATYLQYEKVLRWESEFFGILSQNTALFTFFQICLAQELSASRVVAILSPTFRLDFIFVSFDKAF
jgi:hypothetical protein